MAPARAQDPAPDPPPPEQEAPPPERPQGDKIRSLPDAPLTLRPHTGPPNTPIPDVVATRDRGGYKAKLLRDTAAMTKPDDGTQFALLQTRTRYTFSGTRLMVSGARYNAEGELWLRVVVPLRPTVRHAWVDADNVRVTRNPWFVSISIARRELVAYRFGIEALRTSAVVGKPSTPTPKGLHAIYEEVPASRPDVFTGAWALHLTAFSAVFDKYGAGDGRAAVHGRGTEALVDPLGTAASNGCVRVNNDVIRFLARQLPIGTAVRIS